MAEPSKYEKNLLPLDVVEKAHGLKESFEKFVGGVPLLLIRLDKLDSELALGLSSAPTAAGGRLVPSIGFETIAGDGPTIRRDVADFASGLPSSRSFGLTFQRLLTMFIRTPYFIAPMRKRPGAPKPFEDRISVGRARNNDIVLRHESVSKFHAWFQCDEESDYYIGDGQSRNGTRVNGDVIKGLRDVAVQPGDQIRFGDIESVLCTPAILWDALASAPAPSAR